MPALLTISDLVVNVNTYDGTYRVLDSVNLSLERSQWAGLVGETGCGKTMTALSLVGLLPRAAEIVSGDILFDGTSIRTSSEQTISKLRGTKVSMIFQNPKTACNPAFKIGTQLVETLMVRRALSRREAGVCAAALLCDVGLEQYCLSQYAHELSGGMLQRVMIALALACEPELILADEPTSSLDVTVQKGILMVLKGLSREHRLSVLFITHDLLLVLQNCHEINVMYSGRIVERGPCDSVFEHGYHPYTKALLHAVVDMATDRHELEEIPGSPPDLGSAETAGCVFQSRCEHSIAGLCDIIVPKELHIGDHHAVSCHLYGPRLSEAARPWPSSK